jgi:hypothetical protein
MFGPGIEQDCKVSTWFIEGKLGVVAHLPFHEHPPIRGFDQHGHARSGCAVGESTLADDGVIAIIHAQEQRHMRVQSRRQQAALQQKQEIESF